MYPWSSDCEHVPLTTMKRALWRLLCVLAYLVPSNHVHSKFTSINCLRCPSRVIYLSASSDQNRWRNQFHDVICLQCLWQTLWVEPIYTMLMHVSSHEKYNTLITPWHLLNPRVSPATHKCLNLQKQSLTCPTAFMHAYVFRGEFIVYSLQRILSDHSSFHTKRNGGSCPCYSQWYKCDVTLCLTKQRVNSTTWICSSPLEQSWDRCVWPSGMHPSCGEWLVQ